MYIISDKYLLRSPIYSLDDLEYKNIDDIIFDSHFSELIKESSVSLYEQIQKYRSDKNSIEKKDIRKLYISVYKYFSRICVRCTPFELLSSYSLGVKGENGNIILSKRKEELISYDTVFLSFLVEKIKSNPLSRNHLTYYTNPSIYQIGSKYHYIEYQTGTNEYVFSQVDSFIYSKQIFNLANYGATLEDIYQFLIEKKNDFDSSSQIISFLINSQLIMSELDFFIKDKTYISRMKDVVSKIPDLKSLSSLLHMNIDGEKPLRMINEEITEIFKNIYPNSKINRFFTVNIKREISSGGLNNKVYSNIYKALSFYSKVCYIPRVDSTPFAKFKSVFHERYGEAKVSLMEVLDPIVGIGYPVNDSMQISCPLLEGISIPQINKENNEYIVSRLEKIVFQKIADSAIKGIELLISDSDIKGYSEQNNVIPISFSILTELFSDAHGDNLVYFRGISNKTGIAPFTRYQKVDREADNLIVEFIDIENASYDKDCLLSDLVYMTHTNIDNILETEFKRKSKITYLYGSKIDGEYDIPISDLLIFIEDNTLKLWSKKHKKYIYPINSTVHNYMTEDLCYYHFLSEFIKTTQIDSYLHLSSLYELCSFIPRIRYKNCVFLLASWKISYNEYRLLQSYIKELDQNIGLYNINEWRIAKKLPLVTIYYEGDLSLLINWESPISINALLQTVNIGEGKSFWVSEFLYDSFKSIVRNESGHYYANEFIFLGTKK